MPSFNFMGQSLTYEVRGEGQDLLFLHGLGADRRQALSATKDLQGCRVITLDMPGHGDSVCTDGRLFSFARFTEAAIALLDELSVASAIWGGISMGSGISLQAAQRWPSRVGGLLLVRPAWLDKPGLPQLAIIARLGQLICEGGLEAAKAELQRDPMVVGLLQGNPHCAASIAGVLTRPQAQEAAAVLPALVADQPFETMASLSKVKTRALVFANEGDPLHPIPVAETLTAALPNCCYLELPARYLQPDEHQRALTAAIQTFLADVTMKNHLKQESL